MNKGNIRGFDRVTEDICHDTFVNTHKNVHQRVNPHVNYVLVNCNILVHQLKQMHHTEQNESKHTKIF